MSNYCVICRKIQFQKKPAEYLEASVKIVLYFYKDLSWHLIVFCASKCTMTTLLKIIGVILLNVALLATYLSTDELALYKPSDELALC